MIFPIDPMNCEPINSPIETTVIVAVATIGVFHFTCVVPNFLAKVPSRPIENRVRVT